MLIDPTKDDGMAENILLEEFFCGYLKGERFYGSEKFAHPLSKCERVIVTWFRCLEGPELEVDASNCIPICNLVTGVCYTVMYYGISESWL